MRLVRPCKEKDDRDGTGDLFLITRKARAVEGTLEVVKQAYSLALDGVGEVLEVVHGDVE